jgi:hypothetical protein
VTPCEGCGVSAYCCAEHAAQDKHRHAPWCKALLLSRLLWQCVLPAEHYEALRRCAPPLSSSSAAAAAVGFHCLGRPVGPNGPSRLPRWPAFWSAGWVSYFAAARELGAAVTDTADTPAVRLDQILRTDSLSSILTVRYALHKLGLDREEVLTIYLLGAVFEASQPWVELLAWLPETHTLNIVLTGPDIASAPPTTATNAAAAATFSSSDGSASASGGEQQVPPLSLSNAIDSAGQEVSEGVRLTVYSIHGLYHWLSTAQRGSIPQADVVFALHSGMNEYVSWAPTVRQLMDRNKTPPGAAAAAAAGIPNETPFVVTAWTPPEAVRPTALCTMHYATLRCAATMLCCT